MQILHQINRAYQGEDLFITSCGVATDLDFDTHTCRPNGRNDYQLLGIINGRMHIYSTAEPRILEANSLYLFSPGEPQDYGCEKKDLTSYFWVHFKGNSVPWLLADTQLADCNYYPNLIEPVDASTVKNMAYQLMYKNPGYNTKVSAIFMMLLSSLSNRLLSRIDTSSNYGNLLNAILSMQEEPNAEHNVDFYADLCNMSPSHFFHAFKMQTGVSPIQFKRQLILDKAAYLLSTTDLSIKEISAICGISDHLYFRKLFKKHFGLTPTMYRNFYL